MDDGLYPVFATWAKRHGLDAAKARFGSDLPDKIDGFAARYADDLKKIEIGGPPIIAAAGKEDWYPGGLSTDLFWPKLRLHFEEAEHWPADRIESLDRATNMVVAHTPRPARKSWSSKGLVVGYVQSGKTTNFTSVIAKLADVDYRLVIVLSGIHNSLRKQTQVRLDAQLKGLNADSWMKLTDETRDFHAPTDGPSVFLTSEGKVALAVVKKNATVLKRLTEWLEQPGADAARKAAAVLVIDDEADQASVATARINPLIRRLLALMPRCTFVGYTATPFANVFIDPTVDDLYPRDFILNLPRPEGYFGPEMIFGRDVAPGEPVDQAPDGYDMVRSVPPETIPMLRPVGNSGGTFTPVLTAELKQAVMWFWLATAARRYRGDDSHSTMLVHTSVKTAVQDSFRPLLEAFTTEAVDALASGEALSGFRSLWDQEATRVPSQDWGRQSESFDDVKSLLPSVVAASKVVVDNFRSPDRLDYTGETVTAIAVGGNTLSRGLTLEGLTVSFFIRAATAYDTLMQMGRWFGYRTGYEDLPRIWMTDDLRENFRHLSMVEHEMRADIEQYQQQDLTPEEVAVRIRTHPALCITAKMGAARPSYVSYAGRRLQTRYFRVKDDEWLTQNVDAASALLAEAARYGAQEALTSGRLFRNVPVAHIKRFLTEYVVHEDSPDLDRKMLIKYIDGQIGAAEDQLLNWSVALVGGDAGANPISVGPVAVQGVIRSRLPIGDGSRADIKTLMSKQDRVLDLSLSTAEAKQLPEQKLAQLRNADSELSKQGLLVLYPIDPLSEPARMGPLGKSRVALDAVAPVIGLGIVFPGEAKEKGSVKATYVAVDLTDVERDDAVDALEVDLEDEGQDAVVPGLAPSDVAVQHPVS